jgi:hypothetical protein
MQAGFPILQSLDKSNTPHEQALQFQLVPKVFEEVITRDALLLH